jgi:hypothetical protein
MSLVDFQNKELTFNNALEFFQESMNKLVIVTAENLKQKEQIEHLNQMKQDLTIKNFDF